jgi:hypothetical protein
MSAAVTTVEATAGKLKIDWTKPTENGAIISAYTI